MEDGQGGRARMVGKSGLSGGGSRRGGGRQKGDPFFTLPRLSGRTHSRRSRRRRPSSLSLSLPPPPSHFQQLKAGGGREESGDGRKERKGGDDIAETKLQGGRDNFFCQGTEGESRSNAAVSWGNL